MMVNLPHFLRRRWAVTTAIHARFTGTTTDFCHHSIPPAGWSPSILCRAERGRKREREADRKGTVNRGSAAYKLPNLTMAMA
jgi:hypothetical protein